jgi:hypothetical protein
MRRTSTISPYTAPAGGVATACCVAPPPVSGVLAELPHPAQTAAPAVSQVAVFRRLTLNSAGMPVGGGQGADPRLSSTPGQAPENLGAQVEGRSGLERNLRDCNTLKSAAEFPDNVAASRVRSGP